MARANARTPPEVAAFFAGTSESGTTDAFDRPVVFA